ncbi:MAG: hypothetical protein Q9169_005200 [Polycauliona sp. 2 TL-2023]
MPSELPPPSHPIHDILRMTGRVPPEPDRPNTILKKLFGAEGLAGDSTKGSVKAPTVDGSALDRLHKQIMNFFDDGPEEASAKFIALQQAVMCEETTSASLGGLPTMAMINDNESANLPIAFAKAKKSAIDGKVGKVTVIGVSFVDVEMIERGEKQCKNMKYTSFAHTFVLGVARTGWRIYQAWGEHGYRLDEWLGKGGSQVRNWDAAKKFLKTFTRLSAAKGSWSPQINDDYNECFHVDIHKICGKGGPQNPIVPIYCPWVRLFTIEDVGASNVDKFTW